MKIFNERIKNLAKERVENLSTLEDEIKSSASEVKVLMFFLIIAELFIAITTSTVTDLQLLLTNNTYAIPFLGFSINVVNFFIFSPIILLLIHYNLLSTLVIHCRQLLKYINLKNEYKSNKVSKYPKRIDDDVFSDFINRIYDHNNGTERKLIHINCAILFSIFPLCTQLSILIKFLNYQSLLISLMHLIVIAISCHISLFYWQRISNKKYLSSKYNSNDLLLIRIILDIYLTKIHKTKKLPLKIYIFFRKKKIISKSNFIFLTAFSFLVPLIYKSIILYSILWVFITTSLPFDFNDKVKTYISDYDYWVISVISLSALVIICRGYKSTVITSILLGLSIRTIFTYSIEHNEELSLLKSYYNPYIFIYIYLLFIVLILASKTTKAREILEDRKSVV